jgi:hypothetical protein
MQPRRLVAASTEKGSYPVSEDSSGAAATILVE